MTANIVILQLAVLGVVLESDLGRRKIGWFRVLRPVITVIVIVPFFFTTLPTARNDLVLQGAGLLAGALLGLASVSPLLVSVHWDPAWRPHRRFRSARTPVRPPASPVRPAAVSQAGAGYALIWIVVTAGRLGFAYGAQHVFPAALGQFLVGHQLSDTALSNAFIFLALGMDLFRSILLWGRGRHARRAMTPPARNAAVRNGALR
jgi:hypothetical protein